MATALMRKNFRCPLGSPSKNAKDHTNTNLVISHAELPPRLRKRVHVGSTNLSMSRSISTPELVTLGGSSSNTSSCTMTPDVASATRKLCQTNIELMKLSLELPPSIMSNMLQDQSHPHKNNNRRPRLKSLSELEATSSGSSTPSSFPSPVIRTRQRRLMTPSASETRLKPMRLIHTSQGYFSPSSEQLDGQNHSLCSSANHHHQNSGGGQEEIEVEEESQQQQQGKGGSDDSHMVHVNRKKLYETFMNEYGSLNAIFRAFDTEGNGFVTFERFLEKIQQNNHEQVKTISKEELDTLFQCADTGGKKVIEYDRFCDLFASTKDQVPSPFKPTFQIQNTKDPTTSIAQKFYPPIQLSPRKYEAIKRLQTRLSSQIESKHGHQIHVHGGKDKFLIHAFQHFDEDGNGAVTSDQIKQVLGEDYLKLDIEPHEIDEMILLMHPPPSNSSTQSKEKEISMKEFIRYFGREQRDKSLDMLQKGKSNELASLEAKFQTPFPTRQEIDPDYGMALLSSSSSSNRKLPSLEIDTTTEVTCMQEMLSKRIAAVSLETTTISNNSSNSPKSLRSGTTNKPGGAKGTKGAADGEPKSSPFMIPSQDRFIHARNERTDWTRVGFGGDGVRPDTALYISEMDRFRTTTAEQFSPFDPHGRRSRKGVDVEMKAIENTYKLKHFQRTEQNLNNMERHREDQLRLKAWKDQAKIRRFAREKYEYLDRLHHHDQNRSHR
jgi:Ca2+-binding EF-hand superfamily protein